MTKKLLFVTTILLAVAFVAAAADVTGKWTFEMAGRGGQAQTVTLNLKQSGSTLTGTQTGGMGGRGGDGAAQDVQISNGKVDGDKISFEVTREFQGQSRTTKYEGTAAGSELKLKVTRPGRGGEMQTSDVVAKKATT